MIAWSAPCLTFTSLSATELSAALHARQYSCVAAMPAGFGAQGLPAGIQIIGPPREDRRVLEMALAYERATDWLSRAPDL